MRINAVLPLSANRTISPVYAQNQRRNNVAKLSFGKDSFEFSPSMRKYTEDFYGLSLLRETTTLNKNETKYKKALGEIQDTASKYLYQKAQIKPLDKENPVLWSVTSEFAPVKEGGLGSVPPEVRNNAERIGVRVPTFMPMYLNEGNSTFLETPQKTTFIRGDKVFDLTKIAAIKMDTYRNGITKTIPVEYYLHEDKDDKGNKRQLIFIKCDSYFDGTIYDKNSKTEEAEKFAVMSKALYEFAKLKMDGPKALRDVTISSFDALISIPEPDGMILNDWHAGPVAALMRYKAPLENAYNALSDETAERLKNMRIGTIGHNCKYQGSTKDDNDNEQRTASTNNILNTLFDKFSYDIVQNAKTGASTTNTQDSGLKNLDNALLMNYSDKNQNHTNLLNMGIVLSDFFMPVSKNYAKELVDVKNGSLSGEVQWALVQKAQSKRLRGVINGNDFKGLNIEANAKKIKNMTGVEFKTYNKNSSADELIDARNQNKYNLLQKYMLPALNTSYVDKSLIERVKALISRIEVYMGINRAELPQMSYEEVQNTPVMSIIGRLADQKGIDIACDSIKTMFKNWDKDFPNMPKPIIYIAGMANTPKDRKMINNLLDRELSKEDSARVIYLNGFVPATAIMAASDYFFMPSKFEPCGLTQGESFAVGTPVIASAVGGLVDTVNRSGKHNGILAEPKGEPTVQSFYQAMKKGLNIFYHDKETYKNMVYDSIQEDFSWAQKGRKGPVYDYMEMFGIKRQSLKDAA